jgi:multimeric flavodoxin WrbA
MTNEKPTVRILGISGSPRRANTYYAVKEALKAAEELDFVAQTEFISLGDLNLKPCQGEMKCFGWRMPAGAPWECFQWRDDSGWLMDRFRKCDGLILGTPVYVMNATALTSIFMEKAHCFGMMSFTVWNEQIDNKSLGIIVVGGGDVGGQEFVATQIIQWSSFRMCVATAWPRVDDTLPLMGGIAAHVTTSHAKNVYGKDAFTKAQDRNPVPSQGARNERAIRNIGRNVAIQALILKAGMQRVEEEGWKLPPVTMWKKYHVKPVPGSYVDSLVKAGQMELVSPTIPEYDELQK